MIHLLKAAKNKASCQKGMTLIDLSIAMVVIALIAYPLIGEYERYIRNKVFVETAVSISQTHSAIEVFYFSNNRYVCPADMTLARTDANYGVALYDDATGTCTDSDGTPLTGNQVLEGMVPFKTLKLDEEYAYDAWNNRLLFAVSVPMARVSFNETAYDAAPQNFAVVTINGFVDMAETPASNSTGHYVIVSLGPSGAGARNYENIIVGPCPDSAARESENCDGDGAFLSRTHVDTLDMNFRSFQISSDVQGAGFFDDYTYSRVAIPNEVYADMVGLPTDAMMWTPPDPTAGTIENKSFKVGIGYDDPADMTDSLNVNGDVHVGAGNTQVFNICDADGNNCFATNVLAGSTTNDEGEEVGYIWCEYGIGFATGVANSDASCDPGSIDYFAGTTRAACPAGQVMTGISGGSIQCAASPF